MDAPPIQYCRTTDGVNIAWWSLGEGPPVLVVHSPPMSHVSLEWEVPRFRRFYEALARDFRVLRYNQRSTGMSSDGPDGAIYPPLHLDVAALLRATHTQRVSLVSCGNGAITAIHIAARLGDAVCALVALAPGVVSTTGMITVQETLHAITPENEGLMLTRAMDPDGRDPPQPLANLFEHAMTEAAYQRMKEEAPDIDTLGAVPAIRAPMLAAHYPEEAIYDGATQLAAIAADARLVVRAGRGYPLYDPEPESLYDLIRDFVLEHPAEPASAPPHASDKPSALPLSPREREVIRLIAAGSTNAEIAEALVISPGTVARHVSNILAKTGLKNRADAARYATQHDLLTN